MYEKDSSFFFSQERMLNLDLNNFGKKEPGKNFFFSSALFFSSTFLCRKSQAVIAGGEEIGALSLSSLDSTCTPWLGVVY